MYILLFKNGENHSSFQNYNVDETVKLKTQIGHMSAQRRGCKFGAGQRAISLTSVPPVVT